MNAYYRPTRAEICLDALRHNIAAFRRAIPESIRLMAVVKANAYGHGAVEIAEEALASGADWLGVAFLEEAIQIRRADITAPLLILGYTPPSGLALARRLDIAVTVYSDDVLAELERMERHEAGASDPLLKIHIKVDTGMGRLGVSADEAGIAYIERALKLKSAAVEGLITHYACADETDKTYTHAQYDRLAGMLAHFRSQGVSFPYVHAGNSATAIEFPELSFNMLRLGISMYGLYPSEQVNRLPIQLEPVMSFVTEAVMVKTMPPGSGISYGAIYRTASRERIATLPVGYADGYTRMLTGNANVLVRGRKAPVVGRICMDQCMINVTGIEGVEIGEPVVLFGRQAGESIHADELAAALGTINYEITCMVTERVPRVYIRDGRIVKVSNPLLAGIQDWLR